MPGLRQQCQVGTCGAACSVRSLCCGPQYVQKCGRDGIRTIRFLVLHAALDASNELSKRSRSRPTCFRLPAPRRVRQG